MTDVTQKLGLDIRPQSGWAGAEIHGVDISQPLTDEETADIRAALLQWKVVFFRNQTLDHDAHLQFARSFGRPTPAHPLFDSIAEPGYPEIYPIFANRHKARYDESGYDHAGWHADVTAALNPPAASILRADVIPPYGGDTQWSNAAAAYEGLSEPVKELIDGLRAVHQFRLPDSATDDYRDRHARRPLLTEHPVVRIHPETGEKVLYVNPAFTRYIAGVAPFESRAILELLYEQLGRAEYTVRFKWEPGSVAFWDNQGAVHLAPRDFQHLDVDRRLYRVTLVGDVPVGPDGRESVALDGEPFEAI